MNLRGGRQADFQAGMAFQLPKGFDMKLEMAYQGSKPGLSLRVGSR